MNQGIRNLTLTTAFLLLTGLPSFAFYAGPPGYTAYPAVFSTPLNVLPPGFTTIVAGPETFYYNDGIFYQKIMLDQQYVVVPPPIGAVVYKIPQGYQTMLMRGALFYMYGGVFYRRVLEGYKVVAPPVILYGYGAY